MKDFLVITQLLNSLGSLLVILLLGRFLYIIGNYVKKLNSFKLKMKRLEKGTKAIEDDLDNYIALIISRYIMANPIAEYINTVEEDKMVKEAAKQVIEYMSQDLYNQSLTVYKEDKFIEIIIEKTRLAIVGISVDYNKVIKK